MRQRKIKDIDSKLEELKPYIIEDEMSLKGEWMKLFKGKEKLFLEIGSGKGAFINKISEIHPENAYIGVEGQKSVVYHALKKVEAHAEDKNLFFITNYIENIRDLFEEDELDGIYLNFSDPWPKARHEKRRLTYGKRLVDYCYVIKKGGFIQFKTDNDDLFDYTIEQIETLGLKISFLTRDLHSSLEKENNVMTEYESKFSSVGKNINMVKIEVE